MNEIFDMERSQKAISDVCELFKDSGLSIFECWHVCETIMLSALQLMGSRAKKECEAMQDADMARLRENLAEAAQSKSS